MHASHSFRKKYIKETLQRKTNLIIIYNTSPKGMKAIQNVLDPLTSISKQQQYKIVHTCVNSHFFSNSISNFAFNPSIASNNVFSRCYIQNQSTSTTL